MMRGQTPSQTLGPYFSMILARDDADAVIAPPGTPGEPLTLAGRLLDGAGEPVEDGLIEAWQADADGRYRHPLDDDRALRPGGFTGFGRCRTGFEDGRWAFTTIRPGPVPTPEGTTQAPHLVLVVQARGMLSPLWTRAYLADGEADPTDPVLRAVPADRRHTLLARPDPGDPTTLTLDIRLQGDGETVFLDW